MPQIVSMEGKGNERTSRQSIFSSFGNWFSSLHKFDKFFIIAALLIVVATPFIVSNNQNFNPEAAKGGGGGGGCHGKNCPPTSTATLTVSPNPVPNGAGFTATGTGFSSGTTVLLKVDFYGPTAYVTSDSSGAFSYSFPEGTGLQPGLHALYAYVNGWATAAVSFTICDTSTWCTSPTSSGTSPLLDQMSANSSNKGGGGGGGGGGCHGKNCTPTPTPSSTAYCAVTPNPATLGSLVTATGSGFQANSYVSFSLNGSLGFVLTDATGSISRSFDADFLGTNTVIVAGTAICTFQVVAPTSTP